MIKARIFDFGWMTLDPKGTSEGLNFHLSAENVAGTQHKKGLCRVVGNIVWVIIVVVVAYVLLTVSPGSEKTVSKLLSDMEEVIDVSELYGEYDIIMKVELSSLPELDTFLTDEIRSINHVHLTSTMIVAYEHRRGKS